MNVRSIMERAVYSEWAILRYFQEPKLGRISVARKEQRQGLALWRALVTDHPSSPPLTAAVAPALTVALLAAASLGARADDPALAPREVPTKSIPVPTDVSPGMQKFIAAPLNPVWHDLWKTGEEWRKAADKMDAGIVTTIPAMAERLHVKIEPSTMDGVKVFIVTPDEIPPENRNRLLIHIHGGCYVLFPGEAGATEAITMAGLEHFKVISVDYRMPPEAYFPAALDSGSDRDGRRSTHRFQLFQNCAHVVFHCVLTDVKDPPYFLIALAESHLLENLKFALGQFGLRHRVHQFRSEIMRY
jgi:hypothetical protein